MVSFSRRFLDYFILEIVSEAHSPALTEWLYQAPLISDWKNNGGIFEAFAFPEPAAPALFDMRLLMTSSLRPCARSIAQRKIISSAIGYI